MFVVERVQRLAGAAKKLPVPEGTWAIGAGLIIVGLSAYGFQILAAKRLSNDDYNSLNVLWALVFVFSPGLFQPLEQEVGRAVAARRARGEGGGPLVKRAAFLGGMLALTVIVVSARSRTPGSSTSLFDGRASCSIALFVAIAFYYVAFITRGTLSGNGRFGAYGLMHGSEGIGPHPRLHRVVRGRHEVGRCLGLRTRGAAAVRGARSRSAVQRDLMPPGPEAPYSELSGALAWLLLGSVLAQLLSYASVFGVTCLANEQPEGPRVALHHRTVRRARSAPHVPGRTGGVAAEARRRSPAEGKHDDFRDRHAPADRRRARAVHDRRSSRRPSSGRGPARSSSRASGT